MAKTMAKVAATMVMGMAFAAPAFCENPGRPTVVVHLTDYQGMSSGDSVEVKRAVSDVYARAGVDIEWAAGCAKTAPTDGRLHVDVLILDQAMADRHNPEPTTFGRGSHATRRAYVYYSRIAAHARKTGSGVARSVAAVLAHELGHVVLPEYSHAPFGLMQAIWDGGMRRIPDFLPAQAATVRAMVSASH